MIQIKLATDPQKAHTLILARDITTSVKTFIAGTVINCLIVKMTCGRFGVMAMSPAISFYTVIDTLDEPHNAFNETT